jgi:hypothetical protein
VIRRRIERSEANHPCRDASSSGSGHRTAAQVGHVLEIQPRADLAESRAGGREEAAQGTSRAQAVEPGVPLLGAGLQAVEDLGHLKRKGGLALAEAADMVPPLSRAVDPLAGPM